MVNKAIRVAGNYFYFFPTLAWAQRALWDNICPWAGGKRLIDVLCPDGIVERKNNSDFFIDLKNGSRIKIAGTDNLNFVGQGGAGYVLSEFSLHKDDVTGFLAPILREGNAWVIFNGTLRGKNNQLWMLYEDNVNRENWFTQWLTLEHTKTDYWISPRDGICINPEIVGKISPYTGRKFSNIQEDVDAGLISFSMARQEYLNEAVSHVSGAYYSREIEIMEGEGRLKNVWDGSSYVYTFWDLGGDKQDSDTTAIAFVVINKWTKRADIIDYYENSGHLRGHYFDVLKSKPYRYGGHYIPHDGKRSNTWTGEGMAETALTQFGVEMRYIPKADSVLSEIEIVRRDFVNYSIDTFRCKDLFEHLTKYHENDTTGKPCHRNNCSVCEGASHGCLTGDSMISVRGGTKRIDEVCVGDEVDLGDGFFGEVTEAGCVGIETVYEINLTSGESLRCTGNHKIFTTEGLAYADTISNNSTIATQENRLWKKLLSRSTGLRESVISCSAVSNICYGKRRDGTEQGLIKKQGYCSTIFLEKKKEIFYTALTAIGKIYRKRTGYQNIKPATKSNIQGNLDLFGMIIKGFLREKTTDITSQSNTVFCTDMSMKKKSEVSQKDSTYTTKTESNQITVLKTLKQYLHQNILNFTHRTMRGLEAKKTKLNLFLLIISQKHGTSQKKGWRGTPRTARGRGVKDKKQNLYADNVEKSFKRFVLTGQNTVRPNVNSVTVLPKKEKVYDLTVKHHHAYYANGILVSNSDTIRLLAMARHLGLVEEYLSEDYNRVSVDVLDNNYVIV